MNSVYHKMNNISADRIKSPVIKPRQKPKQEYYEVVTGNIMIGLNDYFDDIGDKDWEILTNRITFIFKDFSRAKNKIRRTHAEKIDCVVDILRDIVYRNDREIRKIIEKAIKNAV